LGDGNNLERDQIKPVPEFDGVKAVVAGFAHSLALRSDGTVWGWGADMFGQLGNGAPARLPGLPPLPDFGSTLPVQTLDLSDVVAVAAGIFHSLALKADGSTWAWGANSYGQVGDGTTNHQDTPKAVLGLSGARALAGGGFHSLAATADGAVWAWGRNDYGQLGNAVAGASSQPAQVTGLADAVDVAAGLWHSLALKSDGTVWCWGGNESHQLGDATTGTRNHPMPVPDLTGTVAVAAGLAHNLALKSDGTVWAWGANDSRQLGDGTDVDRGTPAPVTGLSNAVAIAAGIEYSLALTADGVVWAWGDNSHGQLGKGEPFEITRYVDYTNVSTIVTYTTVTNYTFQTNYTFLTRYLTVTNSWPIVTWYERHYLDVVDYAVPTKPTVREPVNLPGALQGISHAGALLYTLAAQRPATEGGQDWGPWLDASAYDGVEAHLVDSMALPSQWPYPVLVQGATIFLGRPAPDTNSVPQLETWTLPDTGRFTRLGSAPLDRPAQNLAVFGALLAAQSYNDIQLINISDPSAPVLNGLGGPPGCVGYSLEAADGSADRGLWLPLGDFGVYKLDLSPKSGTR